MMYEIKYLHHVLEFPEKTQPVIVTTSLNAKDSQPLRLKSHNPKSNPKCNLTKTKICACDTTLKWERTMNGVGTQDEAQCAVLIQSKKWYRV